MAGERLFWKAGWRSSRRAAFLLIGFDEHLRSACISVVGICRRRGVKDGKMHAILWVFFEVLLVCSFWKSGKYLPVQNLCQGKASSGILKRISILCIFPTVFGADLPTFRIKIQSFLPDTQIGLFFHLTALNPVFLSISREGRGIKNCRKVFFKTGVS